MTIGTLTAAILTLAIFSFLYKENPLYRFAEHLLVGVSVGYYLVILVDETILSKVIRPLADNHNYMVIIPAILGVLMFTRLNKSWSFLARVPLALLIGAGAGVSIPAMLSARVIKQVSASMTPLFRFTPNGFYLLVGLIIFFGWLILARKTSGWLGRIATIMMYALLFLGAIVVGLESAKLAIGGILILSCLSLICLFMSGKLIGWRAILMAVGAYLLMLFITIHVAIIQYLVKLDQVIALGALALLAYLFFAGRIVDRWSQVALVGAYFIFFLICLFIAATGYEVTGLLILVGVATTLMYFYFSREQTGWIGRLSSPGVYFIMIFFGATFGYTVMSRITLLIGRMEFLLSDFLGVMK